MGRGSRANARAALRRCGECGKDRKAADFRPLTTGCEGRVPEEVCCHCEALWIEEGVLHQDRLSR